MRVICTAGHVDHGKSTLVRALTGRDPDRLAEEQRRGLTIDLGFAWTEVDGAGTVAFVDLPGHERFIPTMLAGAGPLSVALFVVAADEGLMPQSLEHLAILDLLEVAGGVVVLTRCDLVDDETAEIAEALLVEALEGSRLAGAEVLPVSAVTGAGLPALRQAIARCLAAIPAPPDLGRPRLWVDRAFSIHGAGTVVTGTLQGGAVRTGDTLRLIPGDRPVRVRGMQVLEVPAEEVHPGWRVALNLTGVAVAGVARGDAVVGGSWVTTDAVEAWCRPSGDVPLGRRGAWTVHVGSASTPASLHPVGGADLTGPGPVRIEMARPVPLAVGDRLVLRESGRGLTAGGGVVLEPLAGRRVRGAAARTDRVARLTAVGELDHVSTPAARVAAVTGLRGSTPTADALAAANAPATALDAADVEVVGRLCLAPARWAALREVVRRTVAEEHAAHPARARVARATARGHLHAAGCEPEEAEAVLTRMTGEGLLVAGAGGVALPGHEARLGDAQLLARRRLLDELDAAGFDPPDLAALAAATGVDDDLLAVLLADGQVVGLPSTAVGVTPDLLGVAVERLRALHAASGPFTTGEARAALGTSRRIALPLLELLDARGATTRDGDLRRPTAAG